MIKLLKFFSVLSDKPMSARDVGERGEAFACRFLRRRGYQIIKRNFRTRRGEIDIIAREKDTLVFVEVKTRRHSQYGLPLEAITGQKQRSLRKLATNYLKLNKWGGECRFDTVALFMDSRGRPVSSQLVKDAF